MIRRITPSFAAFAAALALVVAAPPGRAEDTKPPIESSGLEAVEVRRVTWPVLLEREVTPVLVEECRRGFLAGLAIKEDRRPVAVVDADWTQSDIVFVFVLDISTSMRADLASILPPVRSYAARLAHRSEVMIATLGSTLTIMTPPTRDASVVERAIDSVPLGGTTSLYDVMSDLFGRLESIPARKAVILISDGADTSSARRQLDLARLGTRAGRELRVFSLLFQHDVMERFGHERADFDANAEAALEVLATSSAGAFRRFHDPDRLHELFDEIAQRMRREIVVTYVPPPERPARAGEALSRMRVKVTSRHAAPCRVREALPWRIAVSRGR